MTWFWRPDVRSLRQRSGRLLAKTVQAKQSGQAIVEMAGAITVLLLLVVGIVDFAPAVVRAAQLTQAVRDGAAFGRTAPTSTFEIRKRVVQSAPAVYRTMTDTQIAAMTDAELAVTCATGLAGATKACSAAVVGDSVTVTANYSFTLTTGLFTVLLSGPLEIMRTATSEIF